MASLHSKSKVVPYVVVVSEEERDDDSNSADLSNIWSAIIAAVLLATIIIPALDAQQCPIPEMTPRAVLQMTP